MKMPEIIAEVFEEIYMYEDILNLIESIYDLV